MFSAHPLKGEESIIPAQLVLQFCPLSNKEMMSHPVGFADKVTKRFACRHGDRDVAEDHETHPVVLHFLKKNVPQVCC